MSSEAKGEKRPSRQNFYMILDLSTSATHNEILHAYSRAKMTYGSGSLASYSLLEEEDKSSMLDEVEKAFEILGNPSRRREYDLKMGFEGSWEPDDTANARATVAAGPQFLSREKTSSDHAAPQPQGHRAELPNPADARASNVMPLRKIEVVRSDYEPNAEFESKIAECTSIDGAFLKAVRIYRRLSPDQVGLFTKLAPATVIGIEEEDSAQFHQPVYLRGHLMLICRVLDLPDPEKLARGFVERVKAQGKLPKSPF